MTTADAQPVSVGAPTGRRVRLSVTQQRVWTSELLNPTLPLASMAHHFRIAGAIDTDRFVDAVERVVQASDVLRLVMRDSTRESKDELTGIVVPKPPKRTTLIDLEADALDGWVADRIATPLDASECVYDSVLLRHGVDDWTWWMNVHHLATDASTAALLFEAVSEAYRDDVELSDTIDGDFFAVVPATASITDEVSAEAPLALYGPRGRSTTRSTRRDLEHTDELRRALEAALVGDYRSFSRELSLLAVAAMSVALLAHRLDGRDVITVGVPIHHRSARGTRRVVGPLLEIFPLDVIVDRGETHREMFVRTMRLIMTLLRTAEPGSSPDRAHDIVVNVVTERYGSFADLPAKNHWVRSGHTEAHTAFRCHVVDHGADSQLGSVWQLDVNDQFSADGTHGALPEHLTKTLEHIVTGPDDVVGSRAIVTAAQADDVRELNPHPAARHDLRAVHELIAEQLRSRPEAVVLEHDGDTVTAAEFDDRAERAARALVHAGLRRGGRVGLCMERGIDVLVAMHGVLRAGGAFVMLSPDDPPVRHDAIALDAELVTVLYGVPGDVSDPASVSLPQPGAIDLDDEAYVLYTSGSTGAPKGVPISHRGLADYLSFACDTYGTDDPPTVALHSELVFDLTITSLFLGMLAGGRTVVFTGDAVEVFSNIVADERITFLKATPSQLELVTRLASGRMECLDTVVVGGEAFRTALARRVSPIVGENARIFNEYGPTEAVVGCMIHEWNPDLDRGADVPIGHACPGAELVILDHFGHLAPVGSWGELHVRRPGMASEYINHPELSAERFVALGPEVVATGVGPGSVSDDRWYATGDRARVERIGVAVYGGRSDDQIKLSGVRLEPAEVEAALVSHPLVEAAFVGVWSAATDEVDSVRRCARCGLGDDVPGTTIDANEVCNVCHSYAAIAPQAEQWFKNESDLDARLADVRGRSTGDIDCLHLLSGGKDSTYALYQLVERGWRVHALTLDNGFISDGAKENVRRSIADLGITHEFVATDSMNEIFRDSLDRFSNVCQGCYKTIYTLAVARAKQMNIPVIVTGLSRGQFFETRLIPHQFEAGRFDPDEIDRAVLEARRVYHQTDDAVTRLLPEQRVFDDPAVFDEVEFIDFYRYVDVDLAELYDFLEGRAPWVRPADTGRSTNCLINVAGIQVHREERGYHNYAEPYSWDVRLGHKTREEALEELDDIVDAAEVDALLAEVGYAPATSEVLTGWYRSIGDADIDPDELRRHVRSIVSATAVPAAFVRIDEIPLAASAKVDVASLPAPTRLHRQGGERVAPETDVEQRLCAVWSEVLGVEAVGVTDDFFELGGASLAALEVVAAVEDAFSVSLPDAIVFQQRTIRELAFVVSDALEIPVGGVRSSDRSELMEISPLDPTASLALSTGEEAMLFDYLADPDDVRYNVTRVYTIDAEIDIERFSAALRAIAMLHEPLHRSFAADRVVLGADDAVDINVVEVDDAEEFLAFAHRQKRTPFDLERGPLVRAHIGTAGAQTFVLLGLHHISIDAGTFDLMWEQLAEHYSGDGVPELDTTYGAHAEWQRARFSDLFSADRDFWLGRSLTRDGNASLRFERPVPPEPDGYASLATTIDPEQLGRAGATPFARSLLAAAATISRFSDRGGGENGGGVEMGITTSTKDHAALAPVVGYYLNTLPFDFEVDASSSFDEQAERVERVVAEMLPHRRYPFSWIVRDARAEGHQIPTASFMLAFESLSTPSLGDAVVSQQILAAGTSVADVTLFVQERVDRVDLGLEYRGSVIGRADADRMLGYFAALLSSGVEHGANELGGLVDVESEPDLVGVPLAPVERSVVHQFVEHALATTDAVAVIGASGREVSYGALAVRAEHIATRIEANGLAGARIGVSVPRSADVVAAMLAVMATGNVYVPVDPTIGDVRRNLIAQVADLADLLTSDDLVDGDDSTIAVHTAIERLRDRVAAVSLDAAAYAIFTSGSTGTPRGVEVTHRNLASSTAARNEWYPASPSRFLVTSSIGFDSSMVGLIWPLATGGAVVMPSDDVVHDVDRLGEFVESAEVSHILMVPSLYAALLRRSSEQVRGLSTVIVAGEACPESLVVRHEAVLPGVPLYNEYGPTEATVWASVQQLRSSDDQVLIGAPIPGTTLRVADSNGQPVPVGTNGELMIAGPGVTGGYIGVDPEPSRFVEIAGQRWYRTGDRVRVVDDSVAFLGRVDDQINIGGYRLEPGEVESALTAIGGIDEAVVVAAGEPPVLVAHVETDSAVDVDDLRERLVEMLPVGAIPSRIVRSVLPRTPHGKVDRTAASQLPVAREPKSATVEALQHAGAHPDVLAAWRTAFDHPDLNADDDFFRLGGTSLVAVELVTDLEARLGREVPISVIVSGRTPAGVGAALGLEPRVPVDTSSEPGGLDLEFPLVTLRAGTAHGPLVVLTPAWDDIFGYQELADAFSPNVTVVAATYVEQPGRPPVGTVDEIVSAFVPIIQSFAPADRPTAVIGWSIGGLVATELADRLHEAGERVDLAVLIDTYFPGEDRHLWSNRWWKYKSMLRPGMLGDAVGEARKTVTRRSQRVADRLGRRLLAWSGSAVPAEVQRTATGGFPVTALQHPIDRVGVPLLFFGASTTNPARTTDHWNAVAHDVETVVIDGRHRGVDSIMGAGKVEIIAGTIEQRLTGAVGD